MKMCVAVVMAARIEVKDGLVDTRERQEAVVMIAGAHGWPECGGHSWAGEVWGRFRFSPAALPPLPPLFGDCLRNHLNPFTAIIIIPLRMQNGYGHVMPCLTSPSARLARLVPS